MKYRWDYCSPLGKITMASSETALIGVWFEGQKYFGSTLAKESKEVASPILIKTKEWLDQYFEGECPNWRPRLEWYASPFQEEVWNILLKIPYGMTRTYGEVAKEIAKKRGVSSISPQAVGAAVGHNPISIIVPCHRVVGKNGSLTGYAGGLDKKIALLNIEKVDGNAFFVPHRGSAL